MLLEHFEMVEQLRFADGIVVNGRINLIRRTHTDEKVIVDFISSECAQVADITQGQLDLYEVGYEQLAGKRADRIEVHNLDRGGSFRDLVHDDLTSQTIVAVHGARMDP